MKTDNLSSPAVIKNILAERGLMPKKGLGQNFLIDKNILRKIAESAAEDGNRRVIEIGPGLGALTQALIEAGLRPACVEADGTLEEHLRDFFGDDIDLIFGDFLKIDTDSLFGSEKATVVGNLPYYITTPIITKLIENRDKVKSVTMMIQREVADRLRSAPGSSDYGSLTLFVRYYCDVKSVVKVSRNVFYPVPKVDSEVLKLTMRDTGAVETSDEKLMFDIIRSAFGKRRKTLLNALANSEYLLWTKDFAAEVLAKTGIDEKIRGEKLDLGDFAALANTARELLG
ncbi:MAG: 16S rRNA (adenine(1518)-N(6)/adenine(1519)-N(6))-dimethyltransferase RsmA [Abditibacteriota bacterium]|nr:16S rRNA (adenine(1518)-N(6)/adenine(1519)-N(6))-dimethyltransferase RsmA [Abditibacteriota bacterium]